MNVNTLDQTMKLDENFTNKNRSHFRRPLHQRWGALIVSILVAMLLISPSAAHSATPSMDRTTTERSVDVTSPMGSFLVSYNLETKSVTLSDEDGVVSEFGPEFSEFWESAVSAPSAYSNGSIYSTYSANMACSTAVWIVSLFSSLNWMALVSLAAVNPAVAVAIAMGHSAFFFWVSTNC